MSDLDERTERMKELYAKFVAVQPTEEHVGIIVAFIAEACTYIPLVIEERAELLKDRERLDWLAGKVDIQYFHNANHKITLTVDDNPRTAIEENTLREAIDVAMQKEPK